jgi:hypothetical protein
MFIDYRPDKGHFYIKTTKNLHDLSINKETGDIKKSYSIWYDIKFRENPWLENGTTIHTDYMSELSSEEADQKIQEWQKEAEELEKSYEKLYKGREQ